MKKSEQNSVGRNSLGRPSSFLDDDSLQMFAEEKNFYSAIYEFPQGTAPQTIWQYGSTNGITDTNLFMQYIAYTPVSTLNIFTINTDQENSQFLDQSQSKPNASDDPNVNNENGVNNNENNNISPNASNHHPNNNDNNGSNSNASAEVDIEKMNNNNNNATATNTTTNAKNDFNNNKTEQKKSAKKVFEKTTNIVSMYEGAYYLAIYFQVFDCQARGFTRHAVFVIVNQSRDIINSLQALHMSTFQLYLERLFQCSLEIFRGELIEFVSSLQKTLSIYPDNHSLLSKMEELMAVLPLFDITETDLQSSNGSVKELGYFSSINNSLRPIQKITGITNEFESELEKFISSLPKTETHFSIYSQINVLEERPVFDFGGFLSAYSKMVLNVLSENYEEAKYRLKELVNRRAFNYCAFSVLSGRTLVIKSDHQQEALSLAKRFSIISPFFKESYLLQKESVMPHDCFKYAIVVTKEIGERDKKYLSILDFTSMVYSGDGCPQKSFVMTELGKNDDSSENVFVLNLYATIKRISTRFVAKLAEVGETARNRKELPVREKLLAALKDVGFSIDDEPIMKYWLHCYFNEQKERPVLMNNMSRGGLTLITL